MELLKNLRSIRIKLQRIFLHFMHLSDSIESNNHNGAIENFRINSFNQFFLHMYGFMLLSGSIESDTNNGAIEKFENRSDK